VVQISAAVGAVVVLAAVILLLRARRKSRSVEITRTQQQVRPRKIAFVETRSTTDPIVAARHQQLDDIPDISEFRHIAKVLAEHQQRPAETYV